MTTEPLEIVSLPVEVNIHAHIGDPFERRLVFTGLDVTTKVWTVAAPLSVATQGTDTLVLTLAPSGPLSTRWYLKADGEAYISGTLLIDAGTIEPADLTDVGIQVKGAQGPQGEPGVTPQWWSGTQAAYDALPVKDPDTLYVITN